MMAKISTNMIIKFVKCVIYFNVEYRHFIRGYYFANTIIKRNHWQRVMDQDMDDGR
jgi:hypothetical protein